MRKDRQYKRISFAGINGTRKSSTILKFVETTYDLSKQRVLIYVNTNKSTMPEVYKGYPVIKSIAQFSKWKSGIALYWNDIDNGLEGVKEIYDQCQKGVIRDGVIVLDDAQKYLRTQLPDALINFLSDNRHFHTDIIFVTQSFREIPSRLRRSLVGYMVHKTLDEFKTAKEVSDYDFPCGDQLYAAYRHCMDHPDRWHKKYVNVEKILFGEKDRL